MRLIGYDGLRAKGFRYSKSHLWRLIRDGKFPAPVKPGGSPTSANAWVEDEIDALIAARIATRDGEAA